MMKKLLAILVASATLSSSFAQNLGGFGVTANVISIDKQHCPATLLVDLSLKHHDHDVEAFKPGVPLPPFTGWSIGLKVSALADEQNIGKDNKLLDYALRYSRDGIQYSDWKQDGCIPDYVLEGQSTGNLKWAVQVGVSAGKQRYKALGFLDLSFIPGLQPAPNKAQVGGGMELYVAKPEDFVSPDSEADVVAWQYRLLGAAATNMIAPHSVTQTDVILALDRQKTHIAELVAAQHPTQQAPKSHKAKEGAGKDEGGDQPQPGDPDYVGPDNDDKHGDKQPLTGTQSLAKSWGDPWTPDGGFDLQPTVDVEVYIADGSNERETFTFNRKQYHYHTAKTFQGGDHVLLSGLPSNVKVYLIYPIPGTKRHSLVIYTRGEGK